jgi:hypothetical protein
MSLVDGVGRAGAAPKAMKTRRVPAGGFSFDPAIAAEEPEVASFTPAASIGAVGLVGMLAVQEGASRSRGEREARRHGEALLSALVGLQRTLLNDRIEPGSLERLASLADSVPWTSDPELQAALQGAALRARVELARRGH